MAYNTYIENYNMAVRQARGLRTKLPVTLSGTGANLTVGGTLTVTGATTFSGAIGLTGALSVTSTNVNALAVGSNGTSNPVLNVDASQANQANGINISGVVAGSNARISVVSSASNDGLNIDAKGSGIITIGGTSTGDAAFGTTTRVSKVSSTAFRVQAGGNNILNVDTSASSAAAGLNIKGNAAGSGLDLSVSSTGTDENMTVAAKGAGTIRFNPAVVAAAGGKVSSGIQFGSLSVGLYTGTGAPTFSAMNGSIYTDSDATTTTTRIYVNKSGAGTAGTTWTNLTTAA